MGRDDFEELMWTGQYGLDGREMLFIMKIFQHAEVE